LKNAEAKFQILIERDDNENEIEICCGSAFRNKKMDFRRFTETHWSVKHVERIFFQYDKNGSGKLERKEAKAFFLDWFGKKSWKDEQEKEKLFEEFMSIFDSDGSNSLEFSELLRNNFFEDRVLGPARCTAQKSLAIVQKFLPVLNKKIIGNEGKKALQDFEIEKHLPPEYIKKKLEKPDKKQETYDKAKEVGTKIAATDEEKAKKEREMDAVFFLSEANRFA